MNQIIEEPQGQPFLRENLVIVNFYYFFKLENPLGLKRKLLKFCEENRLKGTILIAEEGVNVAGIAGSPEKITEFCQKFEELTGLKDIFYQKNNCDFYPFEKLKIKVKPEIVNMALGDVQVEKYKGKYIEAKEWDDFISKDDVIVIDTRNKYEITLGSFHKAISPDTSNFRDFPQWSEDNFDLLKNKKVAMFCTSGVRCEKSTSYLKQKGIEEVYHLKGGITKYLEENKNSEKNSWWGKCFVFDNRSALNKQLEDTKILCKKCDQAISTRQLKHVKSSNDILCFRCREGNTE